MRYSPPPPPAHWSFPLSFSPPPPPPMTSTESSKPPFVSPGSAQRPAPVVVRKTTFCVMASVDRGDQRVERCEKSGELRGREGRVLKGARGCVELHEKQ